MNYTYKKPNYNLTDKQIIDDVMRVMGLLNKETLTLREYLNYGEYGAKAICNHFGTWNKLLKEMNIPITREVEHLNKTDIYLIIENLWAKLGHQPTVRDFEKYTHHTRKIIIKRFGSWLNCLKEFSEFKEDREEEKQTSAFEENRLQHRTSRDPSLSLRYRVLKRDNYKCVICGKSPANNPDIELHIDHIKPYSLGGETELNNLQTLCQYCNLGKSNKE